MYSKKEILDILKNLPSELKIIYGDDLKKVILYGSYAREEQTEDSDIDILILLNLNADELKLFEDSLIGLVTNYDLEYSKVFSMLDTSYSEYMHWKEDSPFYKAIDKEGEVIYESTESY